MGANFGTRRITSEANVRVWLDSEVQRPEIEVRLYPSFRHSGQGWEGLKVTRFGYLAPSVKAGMYWDSGSILPGKTKGQREQEVIR